MVRKLLQDVVHGLGYHISRNPPENSLGRDLKVLLRKLNINCVLDVGAHRGEHGSFLRMLGYVARIVSFEPVPENFAVLAAHAHSDPDWYAHAFALGSAVGPAPFRVTEGSTFSSFNVPSAFGRAEFGAKLNMSHQIEVRVERLENVLNECCGPVAEKANIFLKCDTQGYDLEVVRGAGSAIDRILGLQVELPLKPIYRGLPSFTHSFEELRALGFELVGLYPVVRDAAYNVIEVDCLMQRVPTNTLRPPPD